MNAIILYCIDDSNRMHRYYRMDVQLDLFGQWRLMREWGWQQRADPLPPTPQKAQPAPDKQRSAKQRRGYAQRV